MRGAFVSILLLTISAATAPEPKMRVEELGLPSSADYITVSDLNNQGVVTGEARRFNVSDTKAFSWRHGAFTLLRIPRPYHDSDGLATNSRGFTVGNLFNDSTASGVLWHGHAAALLKKPRGTLGFEARAINDQGVVAGNVNNRSVSRAAVWSHGRFTDLGMLPNGWYSQASAINNRGQVVGSGGIPGGGYHAVLYDAGRVVDLGVLPGDDASYATGISDQGQIVGESENTSTGAYHAFLWDHGVLSALSPLPGQPHSFVNAINNTGIAVGASGENGSSRFAVRWDLATGSVTNLETLLSDAGWSLTDASAVNDLGQITVNAFKSGVGGFPQLLLTPAPEAVGLRTLGAAAPGPLLLRLPRW